MGVGFEDQSRTARSAAEEATGLSQSFLDTETSTRCSFALGQVPGKGTGRGVVPVTWVRHVG